VPSRPRAKAAAPANPAKHAAPVPYGAHRWSTVYCGPDADAPTSEVHAHPADPLTGHPGDIVEDTRALGTKGHLLAAYNTEPCGEVYGVLEGYSLPVPIRYLRVLERFPYTAPKRS
jgi:hypothetical protein